MELTLGASATVVLRVAEADLATAFGSGDVAVLATPRLVALVEEATVRATNGSAGDPQTSVGTRVELDHLAATPIGRTVEATARLTGVDGRRLAFEVEVIDGATVIARGRVERVVVDRQRFEERARH